MARPYISITNPSYNVGILSLDLWAFRLRGLDTDNRTLTIGGFSQSLTQSNTAALVGGTALGAFPDQAVISPVTHTFSVDLGLTANHGASTEYTPASVTWVLSGTAFPGDSLTFGALVVEPNQVGLSFSATASAVDVVQLIGVSFSSTEGFEITTDGDTFTVTSPWGGYYNGLTSSLVITSGLSPSGLLFATTSNVLFDGGVTTHNLTLSAPVYFGFDESVSFQLSI
jgi:hypothetical protein